VLLFASTLTWNPVVRLTAKHEGVGQLGTVAGVVAGITPTSVRVASEPAGMASTSPQPSTIVVMRRLIWSIQEETREQARCSGSTRKPLFPLCGNP